MHASQLHRCLGRTELPSPASLRPFKESVESLMVLCRLTRPSNRLCWTHRCPFICCRWPLTALHLLLVLRPAILRESSINLAVGPRAAARKVLPIAFGRVARARGPPRSSLASPGRPPEVKGSAGISIWPKAASSRSLGKPVLKGCTCARNPDATSHIR